MSIHPEKIEGEIRVQMLRAGVIESLYTGYISQRVADETLPRFCSVLKGSLAKIWIVDTLAMEGFDPSIVRTSRAWIDPFKAQGGRSMIFVTRCSTMKMFVSTMAFVTGIPMAIAGTRGEVFGLLSRRVARSALL